MHDPSDTTSRNRYGKLTPHNEASKSLVSLTHHRGALETLGISTHHRGASTRAA